MVMRWVGCFPLMLAMGLGSAVAVEFPAGTPQEYQGMRVAGTFLQAVSRDSEGRSGNPFLADIHLGAAIHATRNNPDGFREGDWIPFLQVLYRLKRPHGHGDWSACGELMPMAATEGPHYGANIRLDGPGLYHLSLLIAPSDSQPERRTPEGRTPESRVVPAWEPFLYEGLLRYADTCWSDVMRGVA